MANPSPNPTPVPDDIPPAIGSEANKIRLARRQAAAVARGETLASSPADNAVRAKAAWGY